MGRRSKLESDINVVPYIDVMLVLLIIFMTTAPLMTQGVKVELPQVTSENIQEQEEPLIVSVKEDGTYYINLGSDQDKAVELGTITEQVATVMQNKPKTPVLVWGDKNVPYGTIVVLMSALQGAGVPNVGLVTENPK